MGFAATTYLGYKFENQHRRRVRSGWRVRGKVYWTLGLETLQEKGLTATLKEWTALGYKIGLLLKDDQKITKLVYGGVRLSPVRPQAKQVADLDYTHGTPANFKWRVLGGRRERKKYETISPNTIVFPVELTLSGGQAPQMIPVASRHIKGSFAQSMNGLWLIRRRRKARR
jgi:hypothetical protein